MMGLEAALKAIERQKKWINRLRSKGGLGAKSLTRLDELEELLEEDHERLLCLQTKWAAIREGK